MNMKQELAMYIKKTDMLLKSDAISKRQVEVHLRQIQFFQHERLIHLLVTSLVSLLLMLSLIYVSLYPRISSLLLFLIFLFLFIPYIVHYYYLENGVQKLYKQYFCLLQKEEISTKIKKTEQNHFFGFSKKRSKKSL